MLQSSFQIHVPSREGGCNKKGYRGTRHIIVNIWNIKKRDTKVPSNMFYVEPKPGNNNKDIYKIRYQNFRTLWKSSQIEYAN